MKFSEHFGLTKGADDDWLDIVVDTDTALYVDPFLIYEDRDEVWSSVHDDVADFFATAMSLISEANGQHGSMAWAKALRLLRFPEPKEFALGFAMGRPEGSGAGDKMARLMADALKIIARADVPEVNYVDAFTLFCDGFGVDRISDVLCNIAKDKFITYTQAVAARHGIAMREVKVRHATWSRRFAQWNNGTVLLPPSPAFDGGVLLTPKRFVKDIPRVTGEGFWGWAETNAGEELRHNMNYDLSQTISAAEKRRRARATAMRRPDLVFRYIDKVAKEPHEPYDVDQDPELFTGWQEAGQNAAAAIPMRQQPSPDDFPAWVKSLAEDFKHSVEHTDLWRALWHDGYTRHRQEKIAQAIASALFKQRCKADNVDLAREVNVGRGPVDFKFTQGWSKRALIEVKHVESSGFFSGISKQLPEYLAGEEATHGVYLAIAYSDADLDEKGRLARVRASCAALRAEGKVLINLVVVDARPKLPASKLTE